MEHHLVCERDGNAGGSGGGADHPRDDDDHTLRRPATTLRSPRQSAARQQPGTSAQTWLIRSRRMRDITNNYSEKRHGWDIPTNYSTFKRGGYLVE